MAAPYTRDELIDLYLKVMAGAYPDKAVTREQAEAALLDVAEDGRPTLADAGAANLDPITLAFVAAGLAVVSGVLKDAIVAGGKKAWDAWRSKPAAEVVQAIQPDSPEDRRTVIVIIVEMRENHAAEIERIAHRQSRP